MTVSEPRPAPDLAALYRDAVVYELEGEGDPATLRPEEAAAVARAVDNRRNQFAAGRRCAHLALADVSPGLDDRSLLVGRQRSPAWPAGVRGSITHTDGYAAAAVRPTGRPADGTGLGIDAEQLGRVTPNLWSRLFTRPERAWLARLAPPEREQAATAVFSAKEAFYKAQFPFTGAWVGFQDVTTTLDDGGWGLSLSPATDLEVLTRFRWPVTARYLLRGRIVVCAVEVELVAPGS